MIRLICSFLLAGSLAAPAQVAVKSGGRSGRPEADANFDTKVPKPAHTAKKGPRVIFDAAHHNMLTAEAGYRPLAKLISNDGCVVGINRRKFDTPGLFTSCEVLVIGIALGADGLRSIGSNRPAFTPKECDAVRDFVEKGGSLLLVTDAFPSGCAAQDLAERFGVKFSKGSTIRDPVFWRELKAIGDHPVMLGRDKSERVDGVRTYTGQTLTGPSGSVVLLKFGADAKEEYRDSCDPKETPKVRGIADQAMALAFEHGKGRVVVLGDGAMLAADIGAGDARIGMNDTQYNNRQFALNLFRWLTRAY